MKIFDLGSDANRFQNFVFVDDEDVLGITEKFAGTPIGMDWQPPRIELLDDADSANRPPSDFPNLNGMIPVFSGRAVEALRPLLEPSGELLRLEYDAGEYYAFNITKVVDVLDEAASDVERFRDGRIMMIKRHAFVPDVEERLRGICVFKLPQRVRGFSYVTDAFVNAVKRHALRGFSFPIPTI